ncbi:glutamate racemase [Bacillus toyonensis]|uniref:glutamate racemase n=1 Tax=Bacillus toyonensis TaxID=155322 RepID=UPI002E240E44|nr:aspartate/glutamate racemase family protein [Bacillus toyonensis]MED2737467.1 aspartate/glutamate racemase family protein [Bacillus toyonensis]
MKIALLDSGIGGWSFLRKIEEELPQHKYLYFADQKNCPYGNKSISELEAVADYWINVFKEKEVDVIVLACNTMTALFKDRMQASLSIPVIGTTDGLEKGFQTSDKVVLLATNNTVKSGWYQKLFSNIDMKSAGNSWLAKEIEDTTTLSISSGIKLRNEVDELCTDDWHSMILGCTHYPLIESELKKVWPDKVFINPADFIIPQIMRLTQGKSPNADAHNIIMYTTGEVELLKRQAKSFFIDEAQNKITYKCL